MAVTIKLKNASGSDPSASDLVVGEVAVRTDNGKLFTKKDDGSVAEISGGGGGIDDGDKGDITVSNSGATFTIDNDVVTNSKLENMATQRIMGRTASGTGNPQHLTATEARSVLGLVASATTDTTNASNISSGTLAAARVATLNQDTTGNAATATALETARTIAGTSFDGSANIDISYANLTNKLSVGDGGLTQNNFTNTLKSKLDGIAASATNNGSGNAITDGDKGDITVSSSGATFTIDNDVVTTAKMINFPSGTLLGRTTAGTGNADTLTASQARTLLNVEDGATADQSASEIKTAYESNSNTNAFTDALLSKLNGIAASATNVTNNNQLTNGAGYITATLTNEQVQDIVGGMVTGNTESGITVTYQDGDGTLDFSVASQTDQNFTTTLKNKLDGIAAGATNVTNTNQLTNGAGFITATLTNEQVQDIVGGMVSGNSESGITVTYQDSDGTLDFSVASQTDNNFTDADHSKLDGIASGATNVTNNNQISNGAGYVTSSVINSLNASNLSSGTIPDARFPSTLPAVSGANLTNISATVAGGAVYENAQSITSNYTVTNGKNAMSAGPISIANNVTVTIGSGETYTIV